MPYMYLMIKVLTIRQLTTSLVLNNWAWLTTEWTKPAQEIVSRLTDWLDMTF